MNPFLESEAQFSNDLKAKLSEGIVSGARFADVSTATRMITMEIPAVANLVLRKKKVRLLKTKNKLLPKLLNRPPRIATRTRRTISVSP